MTAHDKFRAWVAEREATGMSRTQVAAEIGCSESALSRVLSGNRGVGGRLAYLIERASGLPSSMWFEDAA